jgi:SAM-dependent methyltransferase
MSELYNSLAEVYEMMYQTFINYDEEYKYYSDILKRNNAVNVLEIGCGTGNLAEKFLSNGFQYTGTDLSKSMLDIAAAKYPQGKFREADMRNFLLDEKYDACFFAGRTSAYLVSDDDMRKALKSICNNLKENGIVCFDCIDAEKFIPLIENGKQVVHTAAYNGRRFHRASYWQPADDAAGVFNWESIYFEIDGNGDKKEIGRDNSVLRSFTKREMEEMITGSGFELLEMNERPSYAFDTFVVTAKKL